ncbi:AAA family ATPase [Micromonospora sp. NPDC001898]|uniref:AAA family ATPase n=1 Tax=Micromonospora sp. NPDC001898 TaxID=3364221 RepID=UPI00367B4F29
MDSETERVAAFAEQFRKVRLAAGRPTLAAIINAVGQGRGRSPLSDSTLSGWLRGKSVPSDATLFLSVIEYLLAKAPDFPLRSLAQWERLRTAAEIQKSSRRGRPRRSPTLAEPSMIGLPRPPTQPFAGREVELAQLDCDVRRSGHRVTVIHGLSGTGKTELALQYAARNRDRHPVVWFSTADSADAIAAGLARLARWLTRQRSGTAEADLTEWALRWLQEHDRWLLILDDVGSRAAVEDVLGNLVRGHILITTRRDLSWGGFVHGWVCCTDR